MEYRHLEKIHGGKFIHRYDVTYQTTGGREKVYEMISRDPAICGREELCRTKVDAVVLVLTDEEGQHLLLQEEFRMATGRSVFNLPAGLLEPGENIYTAACRELKEETGLRLTKIDCVLPASYSAPGLTNECNVTLFGRAAGEFAASSSDEEEITPGWYDKQQVRQLLQEKMFSSRTQMIAYLWSKE